MTRMYAACTEYYVYIYRHTVHTVCMYIYIYKLYLTNLTNNAVVFLPLAPNTNMLPRSHIDLAVLCAVCFFYWVG